MSSRKEYDKVFMSLPFIGALILFVNVYYFCHPILSALGLTGWTLDYLLVKIHHGGAFSNEYYTKMIALLLASPAFCIRRSMSTELSWIEIVILFLFGLGIYMMPKHNLMVYLISTVGGFVIINFSIALASRKSDLFGRKDQDLGDSFPQCERLIENDDSVNIKTEYRLNGRKRHGWINVINPFRATLVLGTPGAGKSYSVYGPFISQMIQKGYSMFVYDYKFV